MPAAPARAPILYRPKSKIRLRLGFKQQADPLPTKPPVAEPSDASHSPATDTVPSLQSSTSATSSGTVNAPTDSLNASTNTATTTYSAFSRADSRDAFALEISPSTASIHHPEQAFDTVSYTSTSPVSHSYALDDPSSGDIAGHYPTPRPSSSYSLDLNAYQNPQNRAQQHHEHEQEQSPRQPSLKTSHPELAKIVSVANDIFYLTDQQLSNRIMFYHEIGFGNWGSVWLAKPKRAIEDPEEGIVRLGRMAAAGGGSGAGGKVAVKVVHRVRDPVTAARVRALWGEMKIIRGLRHEPHPSVIQFESFVITPSYAMVIMPYLSHLIPVCLPPRSAVHYFRQLASAVGYLHERGITHNDIKPANVMISYSDVPVLVDFGFAQKWDVKGRGSFLSSISWGTPEYLDPQRAYGMPHDERASDVWSLGITFFEILIGRTPFEYGDEEEFSTPDELIVYYKRSRSGRWLGEWSMPNDLQHLIRSMVCPDPAYRISAMQAYHHPSLQPSSPSVIITPHFVRAAAHSDEEEPLPPLGVDAKKKRPKKKQEKGAKAARSTTPALGESIKQHTSGPRHAVQSGLEKENRTPSPQKKSVIVSSGLLDKPPKGDEEDTTPTKVFKPAQPLRVKETSAAANKKVMPRTSTSQLTSIARPPSSYSLNATAKADNRTSVVSSTSTVQPKNKEEAVLRTMRSLEGTRRIEKVKSKDRVLNAIKRPAPSPPRPRSLDSQVEMDHRKKDEQRRSLGLDRLMEVQEESPVRPVPSGVPTSPAKSPKKAVAMASPPRPRVNTRPTQVVAEGRPFPANDQTSPLDELREKILSFDKDNLERFRKVSGDLIGPRKASVATTRMAKQSMPPPEIDPESVPDVVLPDANTMTNDLGLEGRLDRFALWVKDVERIVEDARKAIAEGREPPLPTLSVPVGIALSSSPARAPAASDGTDGAPEKRFGVTPEKASAVPAHLRTCSTQVEPATPPKWMTYEDAQTAKANEEEQKEDQPAQLPQTSVGTTGVVKKTAKKERPAVSHVFKLFGTEKSSSRSNTPEPMATVPSKNSHQPPLRGAPSTPALRSTTVRTSKPLARRSESNLRNFNTMPTLSMVMSGDTVPSPRRAVYEDLLDQTPGVVRQGDGWSSWSKAGVGSGGKGMGKPSSMASLRERALAFLRDDQRDSVGSALGRNIIDLAAEVEMTKRSSRGDTTAGRPATPGIMPVMATRPTEKKGLFGKLRGFMGKKGMEKVDEV